MDLPSHSRQHIRYLGYLRLLQMEYFLGQSEGMALPLFTEMPRRGVLANLLLEGQLLKQAFFALLEKKKPIL
jgi:hypothetical protein